MLLVGIVISDSKSAKSHWIWLYYLAWYDKHNIPMRFSKELRKLIEIIKNVLLM